MSTESTRRWRNQNPELYRSMGLKQLRRWRRNNPEHSSWWGMHERCYNSANDNFKHYGGRGIQICCRWHRSTPNAYRNFLSDMGPRPKPTRKHSIHRIDNDSHYMPSNCRWATPKQQSKNRRGIKLTADQARAIRAASGTQKQIAAQYGITQGMVFFIKSRKEWKNV